MNYIYALIDPRDNRIRYIGITKNPSARLNQHITDHRKHTHKHNWINELLDCNLKPIMTIIESVENESEWETREQFWIKHYRELGYKLTNITSGGKVGDGKKSEQGRINIIAALIKRNKSPKMREVSRQTGYKVVHTMHTPEATEKSRLTRIGKQVHSEQFKQDLAERNRTRKYDSNKMSDKAKRWWNDSSKSMLARKRVADMGKKWSGIPKTNPISSEQARINSRGLWNDPVKSELARAKLIERNKNRKWHEGHKAKPG